MEQNQTPTSPIKSNKIDTNIDTDSIGKFVGEILKKALTSFQDKKLFVPLLVAGLVSWGLAILPLFMLILAPLTIIASIIYGFSLSSIALQASKGNLPTVQDATKTIPKTIEYIIGILKIVLNFIIKLFKPPFIIPGFKYAIGSGLFIYENLENNTPTDKAMEVSRSITKGNILNIFCLGIVIAILNIIAGIIPLAIGTIFLAPFSALCGAHTYLKLKK